MRNPDLNSDLQKVSVGDKVKLNISKVKINPYKEDDSEFVDQRRPVTAEVHKPKGDKNQFVTHHVRINDEISCRCLVKYGEPGGDPMIKIIDIEEMIEVARASRLRIID